MKLLRYGARGAERPGLLDELGQIRDLSAKVEDLNGAALAPESLARLSRIDINSLAVIPGSPRIGPCVADVGKLVCIGLNYADHAAESGLPVPEKPIVFIKATTAINGPYDPIELPRRATAGDWEAELGVIIGTRAKYVDEASALRYVAGYCVANDVSERKFSEEGGGQWTKGKSADTFAPLGPWLVTDEEVQDPQRLGLWLEVNGKRMQESNTGQMVFGVASLISYVSQFMTLVPGDIILTGTPFGTAYGRGAQYYLKPGDVIHLGIDGLGEQRSPVIATDWRENSLGLSH
jgi:2-keto-4-pentenoate hydratase/2-oxohepta-3-ene-1,7-dioic acid hydratase in catechol pathway